MDTRVVEGSRDKARRPIRNKRCIRRRYGEEKRPPKRLFTPEIKKFLKDWLVRRRENPYPNRDEKKNLAVQTGLTYIQVCNWFANWRRKLKNAGKEPQRRTWGDLIKTYNSQVQGNVEHFSICSDDSIWEEEDEEEIESDEMGNNQSFTIEMNENENENENNNQLTLSQNQCYFVSSTTKSDAEDEDPLIQSTKFKNQIIEKYFSDYKSTDLITNNNNNNNNKNGIKSSMITRWFESANNFKPSVSNCINWNFSKIQGQKKIKLINNVKYQEHGREELDAAETLTTLATATAFNKH